MQHLNYWRRLNKALGLMSLQCRRDRYIVIKIWKIRNDVNVEFNTPSRHDITAKIPVLGKNSSQHNQSLYDSSFVKTGPKLWNCLPSHLQAMADLEEFKHNLTKILLTSPDNPPVGEYVAVNSKSQLYWCKNKAEAHLQGRLKHVVT